MLNLFKRCFVAPKDKIILSADYAALEDRVIACLSKDKNKCSVFLEGIDSHCLNAIGYFSNKIKELTSLTDDIQENAKIFTALVKGNNQEAIQIRSDSKPPTFALTYGAFPKKIANTINCSIEEATRIFNNYHNVLYPGVTRYREHTVLQKTLENRRVHLGLGFYLKSENPHSDVRTLVNATCQFWSILTLLTINKMHYLIDSCNYQDRIKTVSTIYDSIYYELDDDVELIQWLNNNLIENMLVPFIEDQTIPNEAESSIGYNWADMLSIPNKADVDIISNIRQSLNSK